MTSRTLLVTLLASASFAQSVMAQPNPSREVVPLPSSVEDQTDDRVSLRPPRRLLTISAGLMLASAGTVAYGTANVGCADDCPRVPGAIASLVIGSIGMLTTLVTLVVGLAKLTRVRRTLRALESSAVSLRVTSSGVGLVW